MLTEGWNGTDATPVRFNFFTWFFPEGLFSGPGMVGAPLLVLGVANLLPAVLNAAHGNSPGSSVLAWLVGLGGTAAGVLLIRRGYRKARGPVESPKPKKEARACVACGRVLHSILPTVELAVSEIYIRIDQRLGVQCAGCGDVYCMECMDDAFLREGFPHAHCHACEAKLNAQFSTKEEKVRASHLPN
jgi:hypothetical protein